MQIGFILMLFEYTIPLMKKCSEHFYHKYKLEQKVGRDYSNNIVDKTMLKAPVRRF